MNSSICALCGQHIPKSGEGPGPGSPWWLTDGIAEGDVFAAYNSRWAPDAASALLDISGNGNHLVDDSIAPISGGWVSESGWEPLAGNATSGARIPILLGTSGSAHCTPAEVTIFVAFQHSAGSAAYSVCGGYEAGVTRRIILKVDEQGGYLEFGTGSTAIASGLGDTAVVCKTGTSMWHGTTLVGTRIDTTWSADFGLALGSYIKNDGALGLARYANIRGAAIYLRELTETERLSITAKMEAQFNGDAPVESGGIEILNPITYGLVRAPTLPDASGTTYEFYKGALDIATEASYGSHGRDIPWAYSKSPTLASDTGIHVYFHGSGGGSAVVGTAFAPVRASLEIHTQDMEAQDTAWREWWAYQPNDGTVQPYPGRRATLAIDYIHSRYPEIDIDTYGLVFFGKSMGGGAFLQTMILESAWRSKISWCGHQVGVVNPRRVNEYNPAQYAAYWPADDDSTTIWDDVDFSIQAVSDSIVRGIHYRGQFSTDDFFSRGPDGNTQTEIVNIIETQKIGGCFAWIQNGHSFTETGYVNPQLFDFEVAEQRVTLDRAHPAFTNSTGNYPTAQADRVDEINYPRGHYNMGILWDWANIVDTVSTLTFPIKYVARASLGAGIPDQPSNITVSVTPRRTKNFTLTDGATINWSWDGGALSGSAVVSGDTVTVDSIPLTSGAAYKTLTFTKP